MSTLKRRLAVNLTLALVAIALLVIVMVEPGQAPPAENPVLAAMDPETIERIAILRPNEAPIRFVKQNGVWQMTAPRSLSASSAKLNKLLQFPRTKSLRRYAVTELNPAGLGLDDDTVRLVLDDTEFAFGDTDAINGWRYVRVDDTVHLVNASIYSNLRQEPLAWVATRLLPQGARIAALRLPEIELALRDGLWQASQPDVSADAIVQLTQRWENAHALSVHSLEPDAEYSGTVWVEFAESREPIVFKLIELDAGIELARPDLRLKYRLTRFQRNDLMNLGLDESEFDPST